MACAGVASVAADAQIMRFKWVLGVRPGSASDVAKVGAESRRGENWIENGAMRGTEVTPPPKLNNHADRAVCLNGGAAASM